MWAGALAVLLTLGFAQGIYRNFKEDSKYHVEKTLARTLPPDTAVFSDGLTLAGLRFFWAYPQLTRLVEFGGMQAQDISQTAYVLVNPTRAAVLAQQGWIPPEFFYGEVPKTWVLRWENPPVRLYWVPD